MKNTFNNLKLRIIDHISEYFPEIKFMGDSNNMILFSIFFISFEDKKSITLFFDVVTNPDLSAKLTKFLTEAFGKNSNDELHIMIGDIYTTNDFKLEEFDPILIGRENIIKYKEAIDSIENNKQNFGQYNG
jgi:hypothetical protein